MCRHIVLFKNVFSVILTSTIVSSCVKESNKTLANLNIVGGVEVPENENSQVRKSTVFILIGSGNSALSVCSGVLIAPKAVMTAAHCIQDENKKMKHSNISDYSVYFTTKINPKQVNANPNLNKIQASKIIVHPNWNPANFKSNTERTNDLAIIILPQIHPSIASPAEFAFNYNISIKKGDNLILAGYGITQKTKTEDIRILRKIYAFVT